MQVEVHFNSNLLRVCNFGFTLFPSGCLKSSHFVLNDVQVKGHMHKND